VLSKALTEGEPDVEGVPRWPSCGERDGARVEARGEVRYTHAVPSELPSVAELAARWGPLTEDRLTRDLTIVQRARGHRFSSDDMVTAYVACRRAADARHVLDLGCGIGSVLLHLAWSLPAATLVGIEAQEVSFALLSENVRRSGQGHRIEIQHGDLRVLAPALAPREFDLVTGTPPYFPPDTAVDAMDSQRAYARIEYRGGLPDYVAAGATALSAGGSLVLCGDARAEDRLRDAAAGAGLHVVARTAIIAHAPKPPLFAVWTLARVAEPFVADQVVLRDEAHAVTDDARALKRFSGF
jgi:tRNA1(Val) A37 N6-methylase TrmN6